MMVWLSTCCCGFSVKSGTKAVAIFSLIYSVFGLLAVGTFNYGKDKWINNSRRHHGYQDLQKRPEDILEDSENMNRPYRLINNNANADNDQHNQDVEKIKKIEELMTLYAVSVSVNFLVSLSLLIGVKMEKKWLLLPWIIWTALNLVISQVFVLNAPEKTNSTVPDILSTALMVYCMLCVISYYQTLSAQANCPAASSSHPTFPAPHSPESQCASFPFPCHPAPPPPELMVSLPSPSPPPAYTADNPPLYDPPPPYPGSPDSPEKSLIVSTENETSAPRTFVAGAEPQLEPSLETNNATNATNATNGTNRTPGTSDIPDNFVSKTK